MQEQIKGISGTTYVKCTSLFVPQKFGQQGEHYTEQNTVVLLVCCFCSATLKVIPGDSAYSLFLHSFQCFCKTNISSCDPFPNRVVSLIFTWTLTDIHPVHTSILHLSHWTIIFYLLADLPYYLTLTFLTVEPLLFIFVSSTSGTIVDS